MKASRNRTLNVTAASLPRSRLIRVLALSMALVALFMYFGMSLPGTPARPFRVAHAAGYSPWLYLDCVETEVMEGDDFRLVVRTKHDTNDFSKPMSVYWYTDPRTADESDYERLYAEGQVSNGYQSRKGKMGRTFYTIGDALPEQTETYFVRFNNSVDYGTDGECEITIKDDDGVGIYDLEIRSVSGSLPSTHQGEGPGVGYTAGDVILVTARFNHAVTAVNPDTGERADYAGLQLQVGENRRTAHVVRGDGTDTVIFGYTVHEDDVDLDGISIEDGSTARGLYFNESTRDSGLWPVNSRNGSLNRLFIGLDDDAQHPVVQVDVENTTVDPPIDDPEPPVDPPVDVWVSRSESIEPNLLGRVDGELTVEDEGRDWFSFEVVAGEHYIVELQNKMDIRQDPVTGFHISYVPGHLVDPSILEIIDADGVQVLGEQDGGGFTGNFARAYFTPDEDGTYYIAVGAGKEHRAGLGFYTLSVRRDDQPDDYRTRHGMAIWPGVSGTARIDSDVSPNDPGLNPWDWWDVNGTARPIFGLETLDDVDVFNLVIPQEDTYRVSVFNGPDTVGIWAIFDDRGNELFKVESRPEATVDKHLQPGTYAVAVGTSYESQGNTGTYEISLDAVNDAG